MLPTFADLVAYRIRQNAGLPIAKAERAFASPTGDAELNALAFGVAGPDRDGSAIFAKRERAHLRRIGVEGPDRDLSALSFGVSVAKEEPERSEAEREAEAHEHGTLPEPPAETIDDDFIEKLSAAITAAVAAAFKVQKPGSLGGQVDVNKSDGPRTVSIRKADGEPINLAAFRKAGKRRRLTLEAQELSDVDVEHISIVRRGAIRVPFRIKKSEEPAIERLDPSSPLARLDLNRIFAK